MPSSLIGRGFVAAAAAMFLAGTITPVDAHSWVEQVRRIAPNGTFTGEPGYPRGMMSRQEPGFDDNKLLYLLPANGRPEGPVILDTDNIARYGIDSYTKDLPKLSAAPGELIALRYQENGHVSIPGTPPDKPANRGTVFVYATEKPKDDDKLLDIHHVWNEDGSGGDKRGKLIATRNYDDGQCHQVNGGEISTKRQKEFPKEADQLQGMDLWCQVDVRIPEDVAVGSVYTMYWVWDWPTLTPELAEKSKSGVYPTQGDGVVTPEVYTSGVDIDIIAADKTAAFGGSRIAQPGKSNEDVTFDAAQDINNMAIEDQLSNMFLVSPPGGDAEPSSGGDESASAPASAPATSVSTALSTSTSAAPVATDAPEGDNDPATVTVTVTLQPTTLCTVVTRPASEVEAPSATPEASEVPGDVGEDAKPDTRGGVFAFF